MSVAIFAAATALTPSHCIAPRQIAWEEQRQSVDINGIKYRRLRSTELRRAIVDKIILPPSSTLGEYAGGEWFVRDGGYGRELHRGGELNGTYRISRDVITIRLPEYPPKRRMYFTASNGQLAAGVFNEGCMNIVRITAKPLGN